MKKCIGVFKTHFDIGFTDLSSEIIKLYSGKMLKEVLETCEKTQSLGQDLSFKWTMSSWPLLKALNNCESEDKKRCEALIKKGQLLAHALPYTIHTEFTGLEELARVFAFSKKLSDDFGINIPISAKMTDVPGHTMFLPTVLASAGVKFLHIGINPGSHAVNVPQIFWWEGMDGSRVLTMYNPGRYGTTLLPPKDWQFPVWLSLMQTNDNHGPQSSEIIKELNETVRENGCEFVVGTMDDFYNEIIKCDLSNLPIIKGDLADSWIHGVGSYPLEIAKLRRNREHLTSCEKLLALLDIDEKKTIDDIYEQAILFCEHTWGLNVIVDLCRDRHYDKATFLLDKEKANHKRMEQSWQEQRDRQEYVTEKTNDLWRKIEAIKDNNQNYLSLFNPNSNDFSGFINISDYIGAEKGLELNGKAIEILKSENNCFANVNIPALKIVKFKVVDEANLINSKIVFSQKTIVLKNEFASIEIDKNSGHLISYYDNKTKKDWIKSIGEFQYDTASEADISEYLRSYARYFYDWIATAHGRMEYPNTIEHITCFNSMVSINASDNSVKVVSCPVDLNTVKEYGNAERFEVVYTLLNNRLNIKTQVLNKQETPVVEALHFNFDFNIDNPSYYINKVGTVINPETDIVEGANNIMYCLENWVDVSNGNNGIAIVSHDAPLFSIGEQSLYKFSPKYIKRKDAKLLFNLCNNMWGTNFPQWMGGNYSFEFDLIPHEGDYLNVVNELNGILSPIKAVKSELKINDDIEVKGARLINIAALNGKTLRLKNDFPNEITATVKIGKHKKAYLVDLFERNREELIVENGKTSFKIKPNGVESILLV